MYLDRNKSFGFISALALTLAFGCSSKKDTSGDQNAGGVCSFNCGGSTGGASADSGTGIDPATYCNGILNGQKCSQTSLQADVREVNMLIVLDESGSMKDIAPGATANKWADMNSALSQVLPTFQDNINFGLELFPYDPAGVDTTNPDSSCGVPLGAAAINVDIAPGASNLTSILDFVHNQTPAGGTPTSKALAQALTYFTQGNGKALKGSKWVLLATDGGPNCNANLQCQAATCTQNLDGKCGDGSNPNLNCCDTSTASGAANKANLSCLDDAAVITQIASLKSVGVQTYVIGIPGSEAYATTLDNMANSGGVPNPAAATGGHAYYPVTSLQDLKDALSGIITQLVKTCDIKLNDSPTSVSTVQVVKDCTLVPALPGNKADGGTGEGFYVDYSQTPAHLVLTGSYCQAILTQGANHLDVIEGCYNPN